MREDFVTFIDAFGELTKDTYENEPNDTSDTDEEPSTSSNMSIEENINEEISPTGAAFLPTGAALGQLVLKEMKDMGLDVQKCFAIGTDACIVMLGDRGAVRVIQKESTNAEMTPCFSHKLNSSISKSVQIALIKKICEIIREVTTFFHDSRPKRNTVLA